MNLTMQSCSRRIARAGSYTLRNTSLPLTSAEARTK